MIVGDTITLEIQKLNSEGEGIGKFDNFVFFVKNTCPGDIVNCKITKLKKNFGYAEIQEILNSAPERITPKCKLHKICGACNLQHISYEAQLKYKKEILNDTLKNVLTILLENPMATLTGQKFSIRLALQRTISVFLLVIIKKILMSWSTLNTVRFSQKELTKLLNTLNLKLKNAE